MTFISKYPSINCSEVIAGTREEEKQLRDSYEVKMSVKNANNPEMKKKNYYRLVNGIPADGAKEGWRRNEWLEESGFFLLDFDDHTKDAWRKVWTVFKKHMESWGVVHVELSARGGLHIICVRTEGLTIEENIRLIELRSGFTFDHIHDLARVCFLVPNEYVLYVNDKLYYSDKKPEPLPLSDEERELLERDRLEQEEKHRKEVEERRKNAPTLNYGEMTDEQSLLKHIIDIISQKQLDITSDYEHWIRIGFCISNICGSMGEDLFHRVSEFYPNYNFKETHFKYLELMRSSRQEITLGTMIHMIREEGLIQ